MAEVVVLDGRGIQEALSRLAAGILARVPGGARLALVGLRTRGEFLARRLQARLRDATGVPVPVGALDITVYRDDFDALQEAIEVRGSQIDFEVTGRHVVLVDDVLFTGRSVRAAMDALMARGRPASIALAVLVDRGHRELPIQADVVGRVLATAREERVRVQLEEVDGVDRVVVTGARRGGETDMTVRLIDRKARAAEILLDIGAVHCNLTKPFIFTSGWASPVYVDCRRVISMPRERREIIQLAAEEIDRAIGRDAIDLVAGGETAGIPFAAWIADYFFLPMIYVRKKPKEFGRLAQIEGSLQPGQRVVLVEDLTTDAKSKVTFCRALQQAGARVDHAVVIFYYGIYPEAERNLGEVGVRLHALTDWQTTLEVAEARRYFTAEQAAVVREFLRAPEAWSKAHGDV